MTIANRYAQEEVLKIIGKHGITLTQIAHHLGCTVQVLHYQLNQAVHFDADLEKQIYKYFAKLQITQNSTGEYKMISNQLLELIALNNHNISVLISQVKESLADEDITIDERTAIIRRVIAFRREMNDCLNTLEIMVNGSTPKLQCYQVQR